MIPVRVCVLIWHLQPAVYDFLEIGGSYLSWSILLIPQKHLHPLPVSFHRGSPPLLMESDLYNEQASLTLCQISHQSSREEAGGGC